MDHVSEGRMKANEERPGALVHFKSVADKRDFEANFGRRKIVTGRCFDEAFLRTLDFPYLERFEEWGWMSFITLRRQSYSTLVQAFFYNGKNEVLDDQDEPIPGTDEDDGFHTYLQREQLRVTHDDVWEALGQPRDVENAPVYERDTFSLRRAARIIYEDNTLTNWVSDINKFSFHNRILHFMVCQTINPRQGSFSAVTHEDAWIMMKIIQNRPPNLAALVMSKLKRTVRFNANDSARGLLYGKVVSQIIDGKQLRGIRDNYVVPDNIAPFGPKTVKQTGFRYDRALERWVRIGDQIEPENEGQVPNEDADDMNDDSAGEEDNEGDNAAEEGQDVEVDGVEADQAQDVENGGEEGQDVEEENAAEMEEENAAEMEEDSANEMEEDTPVAGLGSESVVGGNEDGENAQRFAPGGIHDFLSVRGYIEGLRTEVRLMNNTTRAMYARVQRLENNSHQIMTALRGIQVRCGIELPFNTPDQPDA